MNQKFRDTKELGHRIREMRLKSGLTQEETAVKMQLAGSNTTRSVYSRYEIGELNIRVSDLQILRDIFGCEYTDFFDGLNVNRN